MKDEINMIGLQMLRLCRSVLLERKLKPDYVDRIDTDKLFQLCEYHCLTALVCTALEYNGITPDKKWADAKAKAIRKNMLLDAERAQITGFLEKNHIWYMPLKGSVLKDYYPNVGMRQMSDNDILFDETKRDSVSALMKERGYYLKSGKNDHCDEWVKEPVYNFEMHLNLFTPRQDETGYFTDVKDRLVRVSPDRCEYRFTDEDFYIYMTAHAYKHYHGAGSGLRTLIDYYVFLDKKEASMNWKYISEEISKLELSEFEQQIRTTAFSFFTQKSELTADGKKMIQFMINSGTYGSLDNWIDAQAECLKANNRMQYLFRRLFPTMDWWHQYHPETEKSPVLIVPLFFYRIGRMVFIGRKRTIKEINVILHRKKKIYGKE